MKVGLSVQRLFITKVLIQLFYKMIIFMCGHHYNV